jgi:hypothetical protein
MEHQKLWIRWRRISSTLLLVEDALTRYRKRRPCWSVTRLASITFWSLAFSWTDKPWLLTEGKFVVVLIIPSSWGSQLDSEITSTPCRIGPPVAIPLSGRVSGRASGPSRSRVDDGGGSRCVSRKLIRSLGFSRRGVFIGEGAALGVGQGGLTHRARGPGAGHVALWCG